jgi:hypothetical protein
MQTKTGHHSKVGTNRAIVIDGPSGKIGPCGMAGNAAQHGERAESKPQAVLHKSIRK